jgi:hypothetical protein
VHPAAFETRLNLARHRHRRLCLRRAGAVLVPVPALMAFPTLGVLDGFNANEKLISQGEWGA